MVYKRISKKFFQRHPTKVAKDLLGKYLIRKINGKKRIYKIIETEAYADNDDDACHIVRFGRTKRTEQLFADVGKAYIYSVHINMYCFNIVSHSLRRAGGVMIRGIQKIADCELRDANCKTIGPARVCRELQIDKKFNNTDLLKNKYFFITEGEKVNKKNIVSDKRINIDYAKNSKDWLWRFSLKQ